MKKFFTLIGFLLLAGSVQAQLLNKKVTFHFTDISIEEALLEITNTYKIEFSYSKDIIPLKEKITIEIEDKDLKEALWAIFKKTDIVFDEIGKQVVLRKEIPSTPKKGKSIQGKVMDKTDGKPLSFATVGFIGKQVGIVTNSEGEFILNFPSSIKDDSLKVSFIGYKTHKIPLKDITTPALSIALEPDLIELGAVEIKHQTALSILEAAIAKIPENYPLTPYTQQFYLRDWTWMDGEPIQVSESIYESYRGDVSDKELKTQLRLIQGRKMRYNKKYNQVIKAFPTLNSFDIGITPYFIHNADLTKFIKENDFLGKNGLKTHLFSFGPNTSYDGNEVFVINYDQKGENKALYKGSFYIDVNTLAIIRINQSYSPKGIKHATLFGPKILEKVFGLGENVVEERVSEIQYKKIKDKWYLDHLSTRQGIYLIKTKKKFNAFVQSKSDIIINHTETKDVAPFSDSVIANAKGLKYRDYGDYDEGFWETQNLIKPDKNFNQTFDRISFQTGGTKKLKEKSNVGEFNMVMDGETEKENKTAELTFVDLDLSKKSKHFNFLYTHYDSVIIDSIEKKLEDNYQRILDDFKIKKMPVTEVRVYPSIEAYHSGINYPNAPDWMAGSAGINKISLVSPLNPGPAHSENREEIWDGFVHEFAHVVHIHLMNNNIGSTKNDDIVWLWEAMAVYEAKNHLDSLEQYQFLKGLDYLKQEKFPTLEELNEAENGKIYELGFYIIDYIKSRWGMKVLLKLLKSNGDINFVLKINEKEFEEGFCNYLAVKLNLHKEESSKGFKSLEN